MLLAAATLLAAPAALADDATRAVQEELRKRNLFYGDIDGRQTPALIAAIREYQQRKGFAVTGVQDEDTLRSMGISERPAQVANLPEGPVLRSDRGGPPGAVAAAATSDIPPPSQPAPVNAPAPTKDEMRAWLTKYLEACETQDVSDELAYYAEQVQYFHHGTVDKEHIRRELLAYVQQWLDRQFSIGNTINISKSGENTVVRCRIRFDLANAAGTRKANGYANNTFTLARRPDLSWEIIGQQEQRVRKAGGGGRKGRKSSGGRVLSPLDQTLKKFFNPPKKRRR
ncbi:MAG: peptidoglycan-binding protein [Chthoniobacterales bacterium]|nr:peptidoglycan-binding protein [Chthoniobacterales bacterium]